MLECMRANRAATQTGRYDTGPEATPRGCDQAACPTTPGAGRDLCEWKQQLRCSLPRGDGAIRRSGTIITVTIRWDDSRGSSGSSNQQFLYATGL